MKWVSKNSKRTLMVLFFIFALIFLCGCAGNKNMRLGQEYAMSGDWDGSIQAFQDALEEDPDDQETKLLLVRSKKNASLDHLAKGEMLLDAKRYDEALTELQTALAFDSSNLKAESLIEKAKSMKESDYYLKRGIAFEKTQSYSQAKESFQKALELSNENENAQKALDRYKKTDAAAIQKKYPLKITSEAPISLKFKGTPIFNVFEVLTKLAGINFIFDKDLKETKVTLFLSNVSFDQFMDIFLQTNQLAATVVNENTMVVYPDTAEKAKEYQDLQIRTFYLANLDVKKAVELLTKILNSKDISANESLNALVIRGTKDKLEVASRILEANDRPSSEAVFNVEILEVSRTKEKQLGLDISPASVSLSLGNPSAEYFTPGSETAPASGGVSLDVIGKASDKNLLLSIPTATLNLLKRDGDTKTLAKPQIRVKSGEEAKILIGERIPLRTNRRTDTTGAVTYDYQYQDIGIKLNVKPSINLHDEITLNMTLEVSSIGSNVGTAADPQYSIRTRNAQSVLSVRGGESVIIGGLISDEERKTIQKIPLLGDIPAVGTLFSSYETSNIQTDILMAITPIITRSQEIPSQDVTQIWSGKEGNISLQQPYDVNAAAVSDFLDQPKKDALYESIIEQESAAGQTSVEQNTISAPVRDEEDEEEEEYDEEDDEEPDEEGANDDELSAIDNHSVPATEALMVQSPEESIVKESIKSPEPEIQKASADMDFWPNAIPYSVQVNSYNNVTDAERRMEKLKKIGYDSFTFPVYLSEKKVTYYRVFIGRYQDLQSARKAWEELNKSGDFEKDIYVVPRSWAVGG
jgi:general secretion pathway protein D